MAGIPRRARAVRGQRTPLTGKGMAARDERGTSSAAAPCVAFPAEHLAAAGEVGIMTDYLTVGEGEAEEEGS